MQYSRSWFHSKNTGTEIPERLLPILLLPMSTWPLGDHDSPIFPNLAKNVTPTGPNQLWVADITYIAIATSFVYLAAIILPQSSMPGRVVSLAMRSVGASMRA